MLKRVHEAVFKNQIVNLVFLNIQYLLVVLDRKKIARAF